MVTITPDFRRFIEQLLHDWVVLIKVNGKPAATGFFVSEYGDICSCYHHMPITPTDLTVEWNGKSFPVGYRHEHSAPEHDFAMYQIDVTALARRNTPPAPILTRELTNADFFDSVIALGYAGILDEDAPVRMRLYDGQLEGIENYHNQATGGTRPQLETLDVTVGKGNSGAPLFDLQLFRVIGYVQGRLKGVQERLGRGCDLADLLRFRSDLAPCWGTAGAKADQAKRWFFQDAGVPIPLDLLTLQDVQTAAMAHNDQTVSALVQAGIYNDSVFLPRLSGDKLDTFLGEVDCHVAVLSGASGTGKTNVLVNLLKKCSSSETLTLFVSSGALAAPPLQSLCPLLGIDGNVASLLRVLANGPIAMFLVILDGFNEWAGASRTSLKRVLDQLRRLQRPDRPRLKLIIGARTEFLKEKVPELTDDVPLASRQQDIPLEIFYHDTDTEPVTGKKRTRPVIEIRTFVADALDKTSEQAQMYERYRAQGAISDASGHRVGIRPRTSYVDLPPRVRRVMDRPLVLKLLMIRYDNQEVPDVAVRSTFLQAIVTPELTRLWEDRQPREDTDYFLSQLAHHLFRLGTSSCSTRLIIRQSWYDRDILERLLARTFVLARKQTHASDVTSIGFSSDWLLEYYLARFLWEEYQLIQQDCAPLEFINDLVISAPSSGSETLVSALTYFGEWALTRDAGAVSPFLRAASADDTISLRERLVGEFFEFVRVQYGFDKPILTEAGAMEASFLDLLVSRRRDLSRTGLLRMLHYLEWLSDDGVADALCLLTVDERLWAGLDRPGREHLLSIRALKRFRSHEINVALSDLQHLDLRQASEETRARCAFVTGRSRQFRGEYAEALQAFQQGQSVPGYYGSMCRHQMAFIQFLEHSDYGGAAELLSRQRLSDGQGTWSNYASKLLYANCLAELGRYSEAVPLLREEIERRRRRKQSLGQGKALRTLAQVHFRLFEDNNARAVIELASELTKHSSHYLTHAGVLDVKATVIGLLFGDLDPAINIANDAISLNERPEPTYEPGLSWALQTRALLHSLRLDRVSMSRDLDYATSLRCNPNEKRRTEFIRLLGRWFIPGSADDNILHDAVNLRKQYQAVGNGWYPGVLSLLISSVKGTIPDDQSSAAAQFHEPVSDSGLFQSFLFQMICNRRARSS